MPAKIATLIEGRDNAEVLRDQVAAILALESTRQQALALEAVPPQDPNLWKVRVFTERSNPWDEFALLEEGTAWAAPLVNVSLDGLSYDPSKSDTVRRTHATATVHVDCYGYGVSRGDGATGHVAGDQEAALEAQRTVRLVRRILMAGHYVHLDMTGTVWTRFVQSVQFFQPMGLERIPIQNVQAARVTLQVTFNEFSPQHEGQPLELIAFEAQRAETGEIWFAAEYAHTP
jgi:hypothetical protein